MTPPSSPSQNKNNKSTPPPCRSFLTIGEYCNSASTINKGAFIMDIHFYPARELGRHSHTPCPNGIILPFSHTTPPGCNCAKGRAYTCSTGEIERFGRDLFPTKT